ncbi:hypothetical protein [Xanthomonas campestris]|uniref:hypothetical protein n=1 Tax=Xanthomonas campestris TaxID=339 RepID=UPI0035582FF6
MSLYLAATAFSDAATNQFPLAIAPAIPRWVFIIGGLGLFSSGVLLTAKFAFGNLRKADLPVPATMCLILALFAMINNDRRNAALFDVKEGLPTSPVSNVTVTGGGCDASRTLVRFADGSSVTFQGSVSLVPGNVLVRKELESSTYYCKGHVCFQIAG